MLGIFALIGMLILLFGCTQQAPTSKLNSPQGSVPDDTKIMPNDTKIAPDDTKIPIPDDTTAPPDDTNAVPNDNQKAPPDVQTEKLNDTTVPPGEVCGYVLTDADCGFENPESRQILTPEGLPTGEAYFQGTLVNRDNAIANCSLELNITYSRGGPFTLIDFTRELAPGEGAFFQRADPNTASTYDSIYGEKYVRVCKDQEMPSPPSNPFGPSNNKGVNDTSTCFPAQIEVYCLAENPVLGKYYDAEGIGTGQCYFEANLTNRDIFAANCTLEWKVVENGVTSAHEFITRDLGPGADSYIRRDYPCSASEDDTVTGTRWQLMCEVFPQKA